MARLNEVLNYNSKYENEGILENKLEIRDPKKLEKAERLLTGYKLANLYLKPISNSFDVKHFLAIHKYLFEDVYDFAGEIRSENIKKTIPFCLPNLIYDNLKETLDQANKNYRRIKNEEELIDFIAKLYSDIDIIHPFREGNGRTEREFIREYIERINQVITFGNYSIDYNLIKNKEAFINAVIIADARCDFTYLKEFIKIMLVNNLEKKNAREFK